MCINILCITIMAYVCVCLCVCAACYLPLPFTSQVILTESAFDRRVTVLPRAMRVLNSLQSLIESTRKMGDGEIEREVKLE